MDKKTISLDPENAAEKARPVARYSQEALGIPLLAEQVTECRKLPVQPGKDEANGLQRSVCAHVRGIERELYGGHVVARVSRPQHGAHRPHPPRQRPPRPRIADPAVAHHQQTRLKMLNARTSAAVKERAGFARAARFDRARAERASRKWSSSLATRTMPLVGLRRGRAPSGRPRGRRTTRCTSRGSPDSDLAEADPAASSRVVAA